MDYSGYMACAGAVVIGLCFYGMWMAIFDTPPEDKR